MQNKRPIVVATSPSYFPAKNGGGPTVSLINIIESIYKDIDFYVITDNHDHNSKIPFDNVVRGWNRVMHCMVNYINYGEKSLKRVISVLKEINPDVIYVNGIFYAPYILPVLLFKKLYNKKVKVIIAPRGSLMQNAMQIKRPKKLVFLNVLKAFNMFSDVYWHAASDSENQAIINEIKPPLKYIYNISNITLFSQNDEAKIEKTKGNLRLIYISRIHPTKNLLKAIEYISKLEGDILFDIYGPIEDKAYFNNCLELIESLPKNIKVNYKGYIEHSDIPKTIKNYHCLLLPTITENYGHVIVEALVNKRCAITSTGTPWTDLEAFGGGYITNNGDDEGYILKLKALEQMEQNEFDVLCNKAYEYIKQKLDIDGILNKYVDMFKAD